MPIEYQPKKAVRVVFPNGTKAVVSEEQALRCRYEIVEDGAPKKAPARRGRRPAETPDETPVEAPTTEE